ncbi:nickel-dependent hydrogenase large subunit, partial [Aliarcobacter butzleri]
DIKNPARIAEFKQILKKGRKFTKEAYLSDVYMAGSMYAGEALEGIGGGIGNYMSYGDFSLDDTPFYESAKLFPSGIVKNKHLSKVFEI